MTKKEIVHAIAETVDLTNLQVMSIVQMTLDAIITELARGGRVELRGFGVFEVQERGPRTARNPRTGEAVDVPKKCVVAFKAGNEMAQRVARCEDAAEPAVTDGRPG